VKPYPAKIKEILSEVEEKYKYNEQNDSNEFITIFLNQLLKDLKEIGEYKGGKIPDNELEKKAFLKLENRFFLQNKSFLLNLFYGRLKREYICENGHTCLVKFNNYNTLILPQPEKSNNIIDLLKLYQQNKKIEDKILCNIYKSELNIQLKHLFMIFQNILYYICLDYQKIIDAKDFTDNNTDRERDIILLNVKKDNWYHISDSSYKKIEPNEINDINAIILFYEKI
jgi:ubiquitin C-terminal hydrolase